MRLKKILRPMKHLNESSSRSQYILSKAFPKKSARPLKKRTDKDVANHSTRRINRLMGSINRRYLEIGVSFGHTFEGVRAEERWGVDPYPKFNTKVKLDNVHFFEQDSDSFFANLNTSVVFDGIFIDGLHQIEQVKRDILNSLIYLENGGFLLVDDVVPKDEISSIGDRSVSTAIRRQQMDFSTTWHGDCFKILPFIVENMDFVEWDLIMTPDNPQLLLYFRGFKKPHDLTHLIAELKKSQIAELSLNEVFSQEWMSRYNVGIEEIVMSDFSRKRWQYLLRASDDVHD